MHSELYTWVILPLLIALARVIDVTFGTIRVIFVARGYKYIAPFLGFIEVTIWLLAMGQIMQNLNNVMCYIGYGTGFAIGNFVGINLVEKMSIGTVVIRIIPKYDTSHLIQLLREAQYGVTIVDAEGKDGPVKMLFSIVKKKHLNDAISIINKCNPNAFYTIEEVQKVNEGYFQQKRKNKFFGGIFSSNQVRK